MVVKVDSNSVALRYAIEETIGTLPGSPVWNSLEPNSYGEFGPSYQTTPRNPINASRQRRKGALTDIEVGAAFEMDFLQNGMYDLMPSFMFAAWREKKNFAPSTISGGNTVNITGNTGTDAVIADSLVYMEGFTNAANNGLKKPSAAASTSLTISGLTNETPPATAKVTKVGQQFASADVTVTNSGGVVTIGCTAGDFTKLGLIPGEWFYVGDDSNAAYSFATAADNGWYRAQSITANAIICDRTPGTVVTDTGTGKTIRIYVGHVIKNENDPADISRQTVQFERDLGQSLDLEYLTGQVGNELSIDVKSGQDSKVVVNMSFMGLSYSTEAQKSGTRPDIDTEPCFTGSNDVSRLRLQREDTDATLATYIETLKLAIRNNCKYNKAIGVLGAWEISVGDFEVMGEAEAYFSSHAAAQAIQDNEDVSLDFALVQLNKGWLFDIPLLTLGDARLKVQKDEAVKLPLSAAGVAHETYMHTLLVQSFAYLPDAAE